MNEAYVDLKEKLSRLQWLLRRQRMANHAERGPAGDASRGQGRVLAMLKIQPEISTKDLSYLLGIRQQSLNELLGKLERAEYVTRTPAENDRRVMIVRLTDKGKEVKSEEPNLGDIFGVLSEEEQATFGEYLDRINNSLEEKLGPDEDGDREAWMQKFRERMGDERFEQLAGRGGWHGYWQAEMAGYGRGLRHGNPPPPCGRHGRERFEGGFDGPMPRRHRGEPHGHRPERWENPPTEPMEPEDEA